MRNFVTFLVLSLLSIHANADSLSDDSVPTFFLGGGARVGYTGLFAESESLHFVPISQSLSVMASMGIDDMNDFIEVDLNTYVTALFALAGAASIVGLANPVARNDNTQALIPATLINIRGLGAGYDLGLDIDGLRFGLTASLEASALVVVPNANRDGQFARYGATYVGAGVGPAVSYLFSERLSITSGLTGELMGSVSPSNQIQFAGFGAVSTTDLWVTIIHDILSVRVQGQWQWRHIRPGIAQSGVAHDFQHTTGKVELLVNPLFWWFD